MSFRPAERDDSALLLRWRQEAESEGTTGGWWEGKPATAESHAEWLSGRLGKVLILIWEENGLPAGCVRIESNGELSFHVPAHLRSSGVAYRMLVAAQSLAGDYGGRLKAVVDAGNFEAWEALRLAGWREYPVKFLCFKQEAA